MNEIGGDLLAVFHGDAPGVDKLGEAGPALCGGGPVFVWACGESLTGVGC